MHFLRSELCFGHFYIPSIVTVSRWMNEVFKKEVKERTDWKQGIGWVIIFIVKVVVQWQSSYWKLKGRNTERKREIIFGEIGGK